jgi:hypothetical protein
VITCRRLARMRNLSVARLQVLVRLSRTSQDPGTQRPDEGLNGAVSSRVPTQRDAGLCRLLEKGVFRWQKVRMLRGRGAMA